MLMRIMLLLSVVAASAPAQKVRTEYDHEASFAAKKRYAWREHPFVAKHPEVREYTVAAQLIQSESNEILMGRGYQPVDEKPDIYVTYFVMAKIKQEITSVPATGVYAPGAHMWPYGWYAWSPAWFSAWDTEVRDYLQGILLIDIVDAQTNKLVWRAIGRDKIEEMRTRDQVISRVVKKVLKSFPPKDAK